MSKKKRELNNTNKKEKKKIITIVSIVVIIILVIGGLLLNYFSDASKDARRFAKEHGGVTNNNVFRYVTLEEALKILEKETGIVYFGESNNDWSKQYAKYLNEAAKESRVKKVYYCNIASNIKNNTKNYQKLLEKLHNLLHVDDYGKEYLKIPYVAFVKNGSITNYDDETSLVYGEITPDKYWTDFEIKELKVLNGTNTITFKDNNNEIDITSDDFTSFRLKLD